MNAITYFRLNSPYDGDITKNCALTGLEVDNNFYTLEGRDIKSLKVQNGKIVINLMNGDELTTDNITENCITDIDFDEVNGILTIIQNGVEKKITGFVTDIKDCEPVYSDGTLLGNGFPMLPLGLSPMVKTGQYRPVKKILNVLEGEKLPSRCEALPGDRYITIEKVSDFGYLYNYEGLKRVACKLRETNSQWRIPTKDDWDDMLDAIEIEKFRNHRDARSNKYLGKVAGKLLKSREYWKEDEPCDCDCDCNHVDDACIDYDTDCCNNDCNCGHHTPCHPSYCGEYGNCHHRQRCDNSGIDAFGFRIVPAGYANEAKDFMYFKERAYFWTATNHEYRDAYIKTFLYNKSCVLQDVMASDNFMSVRLVKDYDGINYSEQEEILGGPYATVIMPSLKHGSRVWMSVNLAAVDCECGCGCDCQYVLPNNGEGFNYVKKFFINEWNGRIWLKNELKDGESVVVINNLTDDKYSEYRVVNGELVNVETLIYDRVIETITPITDGLQESIDDLNRKLDAEIDRSTGKDAEHDEAISNLEERVTTAEENIQTNADNIQELSEHLEQTDANLATLREDFTNAVNEINDALEEERTIRAEKDAELENAIAAEQQARIDKDNELTQAIEDEATERLTEDVRLQEEIENIDAKLEQEIENRIEGDETLDGKILTPDGTEFDANTGILTLKSKAGTNDIDVQFNFNFGTF